MTDAPDSLELQLSEDVSRFYADPLGFVKYAYPWGQPGLLEHHDGPDKWQSDFLVTLGEEVKKRAFDGIHPVTPIRMCVVSVAACRKYKAEGFATLPKILAVDVARFGDDRSVIGLRQGRKFQVLGKYRGLDTVQLTRRVIEFQEREQPDATVVDGDGLGAGVVDQLRDRGFTRGLHEFHGAASADDSDKYFNRRAEVWGLAAEWLHALAEIPDDSELETDLTAPQYGFSAKQQIQLEKKDDMKARGCASPDLGDVLAMTFAAKVRSRHVPAPQLIYSFPDMQQRWMQ